MRLQSCVAASSPQRHIVPDRLQVCFPSGASIPNRWTDIPGTDIESPSITLAGSDSVWVLTGVAARTAAKKEGADGLNASEPVSKKFARGRAKLGITQMLVSPR